MYQENGEPVTNNFQFVIIDDDQINNYCAQLMIKNVYNDIYVRIFSDPVKGLNYFKTDFKDSGKINTILFLDINMPGMSGWDFLDEFDKLENQIKQQVSIQMVSSSIDQRDKKRALSYPIVSGFISKPITRDFYESLTKEVFRSGVINS